MSEASQTLDGWFCLHDLRRINWTEWKKLSGEERHSIVNEFIRMLEDWQQVEDNGGGSHAVYTIVGQKADLIFMLLRPTMNDLNDIENAFNKTG